MPVLSDIDRAHMPPPPSTAPAPSPANQRANREHTEEHEEMHRQATKEGHLSVQAGFKEAAHRMLDMAFEHNASPSRPGHPGLGEEALRKMNRLVHDSRSLNPEEPATHRADGIDSGKMGTEMKAEESRRWLASLKEQPYTGALASRGGRPSSNEAFLESIGVPAGRLAERRASQQVAASPTGTKEFLESIRR
jgi:hypothetical protein